VITGHTHLPCNGVRRDRSEVTNHLVDRTALTPDPAITAVLHGVALDPASTTKPATAIAWNVATATSISPRNSRTIRWESRKARAAGSSTDPPSAGPS
jgi:hypothetical protein